MDCRRCCLFSGMVFPEKPVWGAGQDDAIMRGAPLPGYGPLVLSANWMKRVQALTGTAYDVAAAGTAGAARAARASRTPDWMLGSRSRCGIGELATDS